MKTSLITAFIAITALHISSCATVETTTVNPDGSKTTTKTTTIDPASATAIANAAANAALERSRDSGK